MNDFKNENPMGSVVIEPPRPEEDAASSYIDVVDASSAAREEQQWSELLGGKTEEPKAGPASDRPAQQVDAPESGDETFMDKAGNVASDIGRGLTEAPGQIVGGVADAFDEAGQVLQEMTGVGGFQILNDDGELDFDYLNWEEWQEQGKSDAFTGLFQTEDADTATGGFVRSTAQFMAGFIPALKGVKAAGVTGAVSSAMAAGAVADAVVFDPHEDRLSTFLNEVPALEPYVSDYLADNNPENESSWEGRMKNAIEGAGLGLVTDAAGALFRAFKYYKVQRNEGSNFVAEDPSVQAQAGRDALKEAAREELVQDIPDEALAPLGRSDGPLLTSLDPAAPEAGKIESYLRTVKAEERAAVSIERNDALSKINIAAEGAQARLGVDTPDAAFEALLDGVRGQKEPSAGAAKPVAGIIKSLGGIDPTSGVAAELKALGVTSRTHPGIFKKGGLKALDNIPTGDQPIFQAQGLDDGNGYVPEQAWIDGVQSELAGDPWRSLDDQARYADEIQPIEDLAEELRRLDIDPSEMSNANIRKRLDEIIEEEEALAREFAPRDGVDDVAETETASIESVIDAVRGDGLDFSASERGGVINLSKIVVPKDLRGEGAGTKAMKSMIAYADDTGQTISLSPSSDFGGSKARLLKFYKSLGFVANKGRNKDYEISESMYRVADPDQVKTKKRSGSTTADLEDVLDAEMPDSARPEAQGDAAPKGKVFINHARINSPDDVKAIIQEMADLDAPAINDKARGVVTNEQTIKESSQEYKDLDDLIGRPPGPMSAAQAVAARKLLTSSGEQIVDLAKRASAADASPADIYNFRRSMAVHYAIQSEVIAARTETARALQSWAIPAGATKARSQAISELIMQGGGAGDLQQLAKAVGTVGDNPAALNAMTRELGRGRFGRAMYQVWINGILSGAKTHVVNIASNAAVAMWAIPERAMAAGVSKAFYNGEIDAAEIGSMAYGFAKGARDGVRMIYHANQAADVGDLSGQFDALGRPEIYTNAVSAEAFGLDSAGPFGVGMDFIGKIVGLPGTFLQAEDKFFKSMGYRMQLNALASRTALSEGLEGADFAKRVADILADPPPNLTAEAVDYSAVQTFTNKLGPTGQKGMQFIRAVPGGRLVMPFVQTPTNIVKYAFARTPLAYISGAIRSDIQAGGARAAQAHARIATGSILMLAIADMTLEGTVTGGGPTDNQVKKAWRADGNIPYSVRIGDRNYSYSRLDPIGLMIGLAADIAEISNQANREQSEEIVMAGVTALAGNLASKTYLRGIFDFIGAIDISNPMKNPTSYIQNFSGSLMPFSSFLRSTAQTMDPIMRDTKSVIRGADGETDGVATFLQNSMDKIRSNIPGMSDELPPRRDLFGEPIDRSSGLGMAYDFASPVASKIAKDDPVIKVIVDNNIKVSNPPRIIGGVELTAEQYSEFARMSGEPLKVHLDKLVKTKGFQRLSDGPDGMKAEVVRDAVNTFRDRAKALMLREYPELQRLSYQKKLQEAQILKGN